MKITTALPKKESVTAMIKSFYILEEELKKLEVITDRGRTIMGTESPNYDFVSIPLNRDSKFPEMETKERHLYFDFKLVRIKGEHIMIVPKMSHSYKGMTKIKEVIEKLEVLYSINEYSTKEEEQKSLLEKKELWDKYKFDFGEICNEDEFFKLKENEIIMSAELKHETKIISKIISLVDKANTKNNTKKRNIN